MTKNAYAQSGVDVEAGYEVVERIKKHVARTERAGVMGALGGFGGMFDLSKTGVKEPVLISGTDGVGTKLMLAIKYDKHDTCLLYTSPSPRDQRGSRMPSSA